MLFHLGGDWTFFILLSLPLILRHFQSLEERGLMILSLFLEFIPILIYILWLFILLCIIYTFVIILEAYILLFIFEFTKTKFNFS